MADQLQVVHGDWVVGHLRRHDDGTLEFAYSAAAVAQSEGQLLLSVSLPVRTEPYSQEQLLPFFQGLLPEENVLTQIARRLQLSPLDVFGLLREIGRDCAGAFSIVPEGYDHAAAGEEGVDWLSDDDLKARVRDLSARPLAIEPDRDIRISLAGAQDKMAVVYDGTRIGLPRGTTPSTHILKPAPEVLKNERRGALAFPALVANEAFCMKLAGLAGLSAAVVEVIQIAKEPALLITRFDRETAETGHIRRLHQEDFGQALGVPTLRKYEAQGGPSNADFVRLIRSYSARAIEDLQGLLDRLAFNYAIGNADGHAKNFSLLFGRDGIRLAPGYDLLSTHVYDQLSHDMATQVGDVYDGRAIQPVHWQKEVVRLDLDQDLYAARLAALADRVEGSLDNARAWIADRGLADRRIDEIGQLFMRRAKLLRGMRGLAKRARPPRI